MPSSEIPSILEDLRAGVSASDTDAVRNAVDELREEYDRIRPSENALLQRAVTARDGQSLSRERRQTVNDLARRNAALKLPRSSIVTLSAYYVTDPSQVEDEEMLDTAESLANEESSFVDSAAEAAPILDEIELPPSLAFTKVDGPKSALPKGSDFDLEIALGNVGDESAEAVGVSITSDLPVTPTNVDIGTLVPDSDATVTATIEGGVAGTFTVEFVAEATDADAASRVVEVTVLDKAGYISRAREDLQGALGSLDDTDLSRGKAKGVRTKLEAADKKLEDAKQFADRKKAEQTDKTLIATANVLGAALNQIAAGENENGNRGKRGGGRDYTEPSLLIGTIESLIDRLAAAREAEM